MERIDALASFESKRFSDSQCFFCYTPLLNTRDGRVPIPGIGFGLILACKVFYCGFSPLVCGSGTKRGLTVALMILRSCERSSTSRSCVWIAQFRFHLESFSSQAVPKCTTDHLASQAQQSNVNATRRHCATCCCPKVTGHWIISAAIPPRCAAPSRDFVLDIRDRPREADTKLIQRHDHSWVGFKRPGLVDADNQPKWLPVCAQTSLWSGGREGEGQGKTRWGTSWLRDAIPNFLECWQHTACRSCTCFATPGVPHLEARGCVASFQDQMR